MPAFSLGNHMKYIILLLLLVSFSSLSQRNLVLVTIDGLRWQEVFKGPQYNLMVSKRFVENEALLKNQFWLGSEEKNRAALMPFLWQTIAKEGVLIGDREQGSLMAVANDLYFSYPGYSDLLTGVVNTQITSNAKVNNQKVSFLEWLNTKPSYNSNLAIFGGWDVFPYILNEERSKLHVNAGFDAADHYSMSKQATWLNKLQNEIPSPWETVRLDAFTYGFAEDYLTQVQPRVMMIAFGETDDFAHDGDYQHYLTSARRTDMFIERLWNKLQSMPKYKNNTNLLIVTDHGRGSTTKDWQHHASKSSMTGYMKKLAHFKDGIIGSNHIWMAGIGPDIKSLGIHKTNVELLQTQIAATALSLLNEDPKDFNANAAAPITEIIK